MITAIRRMNLNHFEAAKSESKQLDYSLAAAEFAALGREAYQHGWVPAGSGNFSALLSLVPFRLLVTRKAMDKSSLSYDDFVVVDQTGALVQGSFCPSPEAVLHIAIIRSTASRAVLHTHSLHSTMISGRCARAGGVFIPDCETGDHEWLPILRNSQDYRALERDIEKTLARNPGARALLLHGRGLFTWGCGIAEAAGHLETFESGLELQAGSRA